MDDFSTDSFFAAQGGYNPSRADFIRRQSDRNRQRDLAQYAAQTDPRAQMVMRLLQQNVDPTGNQFGGPGAMLLAGSLMNSTWLKAFTGGSRQQMLTGISAGLENMSNIRTSQGTFHGPGVFTNQLSVQAMRAIEDEMFTPTGGARTNLTHGLNREELGRVMAMAGQRGLLSDIQEMATVQEFRTRDEVETALKSARERAKESGSSFDAGVVSDLEALEASLGDSDEFNIPRRVLTMSEDAKRKIAEVAEEGAKAIAAMKDMLGDLGDNDLWTALEDFTGGRIASRRALAEATERVETMQMLAAVGGGDPEAYMALHGQLIGFLSGYARTDSVSASRMADQVLGDVANRRTALNEVRGAAQSLGLTVSDDMEDRAIATMVKDASIIDREFGDAMGGLLLMQMSGNVSKEEQDQMMEDYQSKMVAAANNPAEQRRITSEFFKEAQRVSGISGRDARNLLDSIEDPRLALTGETQDFVTQTSRNIAREREAGQLRDRLAITQFRGQDLTEAERNEKLDNITSFVSRFGIEGLRQLQEDGGMLEVEDPSAPGGTRMVPASEIAGELGLESFVGDERALQGVMSTIMSMPDLHTLAGGSEREKIMARRQSEEFFMQRMKGEERFSGDIKAAFSQGLFGGGNVSDRVAFDYFRMKNDEPLVEAPLDGDDRPDFARMRQMEKDDDLRFFEHEGSWLGIKNTQIEESRKTVGEQVEQEFLERIGFEGGVEAWREASEEEKALAIRSTVESIALSANKRETRRALSPMRWGSGSQLRDNAAENTEQFNTAAAELDMIATQSPEAAALVVRQINEEITRLEKRNEEKAGDRRFEPERRRNTQRIEELRELSQKHGGALQNEDMFAQVVGLLQQIATNTGGR